MTNMPFENIRVYGKRGADDGGRDLEVIKLTRYVIGVESRRMGMEVH